MQHQKQKVVDLSFLHILISVTGLITVEAIAAGTATITVKCGTAEDVVIEAAVEAAAPAGPEDGALCTPVDGFAVMVFGSEDLRDYAGKIVTISVSVCKRGDAEVAVHLQTTETYQGIAGDKSWNQPITEEWTTYTSDYPVPADWATNENPVYFGLLMSRADNGQGDLLFDYDACDYYYKDFSVVEKVVDESKEFYLEGVKDVAFSDDAGEDGGLVIANVYLDGSNISGKLPSDIKTNAELATAVETLEGIVEYIESFEVEITLTNGTPKSESEHWTPQVQAIPMGSNYNGNQYNECYDNLGKATAEAPVTKTLSIPTSLFADWDDPALGQIQIQLFNASPQTPLAGTYSIKVILK